MNWKLIETAPKDKRILLYCPGYAESPVICGRWNNDKYAAHPKPYWTNDLEHFWGKKITKSCQPTHWMELPDPPNTEASEQRQ